MDNLHNRLTFDLGKKNKIFYYSTVRKSISILSLIAKFGGEMLSNTENIVKWSFHILCIFVLRGGQVAIFLAISA